MIDKIQKYQPLRTLFIAFAVVASLVTICIAGCELIMERVLCGFDVQREIVSPSNKLKIVVFDYGCGVGSDTNTQVSVMPNSKPFSVHLGSIATITNAAGAVVERLSYDAWGKRRFPNGQDDPSGSIASQTTRGFTGHEQLAEVGLIHMNGRVYDPMLGRFGTPDPVTENPSSTQGWNRYAYVGNSPLNFADPSGYCFQGCFWQAPFKALGAALRRTPILGNILQVAAAAICTAGTFGACSPIAAAIISSAVVTGLASGDLGQALKAGLITATTAVAFNIAGSLTGGLPVANIAAHAAIGCGVSVASGGKCGPGALSGAVGSIATPLAEGLDFVPRLVVTSVSGGLASVAGGGFLGVGAAR